MMQKGFVPVLIIILVAAAALAGGFWIYQSNPPIPSNPTPTPKVACTQDAKLCPDGTGVGRTGPKCDFAPCPTPKESTSSAETANWKDITFNRVRLKIPSIYQSGYLGSSSRFAIDPRPIPQTSSYGDFTPAFSLELIKNKTIEQTRQEFLNQQGYTDKAINDISVDGKLGLKMAKVLPPGQDVVDHHIYDVYLSVGQDLYHFSSFDLSISRIDQQNYFNQILSTFKFLDQNALDQNDGNCQPRPVCLDAKTTPRCLMPEPAEGWCP